ncbi:MAG: multidrug transporter [Proteobacteria bacterium]|nr:multidrug transporter [Pseudomonadota bacterium]NBP13044.1 multidrug transporter [bacterium]
MKKLTASIVASLVLATFALADSGTASDDGDWTVERGFAAVGDLLVVRPLGAAATVGGFGLFAVASPFAAMADGTEDVFNTLVKQPAEYTFVRDLGDFSK